MTTVAIFQWADSGKRLAEVVQAMRRDSAVCSNLQNSSSDDGVRVVDASIGNPSSALPGRWLKAYRLIRGLVVLANSRTSQGQAHCGFMTSPKRSQTSVKVWGSGR